MMRSVATTIAIAAACAFLPACGVGSVLGISKPTIDLNSEESSMQMDAMAKDCTLPDGEPESEEASENALKDYFRCIGEKVNGTKLTMDGIVLAAIGEQPITGTEIPNFVMLAVGNDNSVLMPTIQMPGEEPPLAPYNFSFLCPRSVSGCSELQKGDQVSLTAELQTKTDLAPTEGMPVGVITSITT